MKRTRNRHLLTIEESLQLLKQGNKITCADGFRWFQYSNVFQFGKTYISRVAMDHLRNHGYISCVEVNAHWATWAPTAKAQA